MFFFSKNVWSCDGGLNGWDAVNFVNLMETREAPLMLAPENLNKCTPTLSKPTINPPTCNLFILNLYFFKKLHFPASI
jgi:hypothetical protein